MGRKNESQVKYEKSVIKHINNSCKKLKIK